MPMTEVRLIKIKNRVHKHVNYIKGTNVYKSLLITVAQGRLLALFPILFTNRLQKRHTQAHVIIGFGADCA